MTQFFFFVLILPISVFLLNSFLNKKNYLMSYNGQLHQNFTSPDKVPLSGGILLLFCYLIIFNENSIVLNIFFIFIFLLGLFSDFKKNLSAKKRLIFQFLIILFFIILMDVKIENVRLVYFNILLENYIFNLFFISFCFLILINGTNFIDGVNTNVLGYYLIISFVLFQKNYLTTINMEFIDWMLWCMCLSIIYLYNFFKKLFIGDNGSYFLSLMYGYYIVKIYSLNQQISPYFIILVLWYPCFELLFSMIRKMKLNKSPLLPDTNHLHQLIFYFLTKKNIKFQNTISAILINLYNCIIIVIGFQYIYNSYIQVTLVTLNIILYIVIYNWLLKIRFKI